MDTTELRRWCAGRSQQQKELLMRLAGIPAPSHHEEARAAFILDWLASRGISAHTDGAGSVVVPVSRADGDGLTFTPRTRTWCSPIRARSPCAKGTGGYSPPAWVTIRQT